MSEAGTVAERSATCPQCGRSVILRGIACAACAKLDRKIDSMRGQRDHKQAYYANKWKSGLRDSVDAQPDAHLGTGFVTWQSAVPSRRLINSQADLGTVAPGEAGTLGRTTVAARVPQTVRSQIGRLAHAITAGTTRMDRECAELRLLLGHVAREGQSTADVRRQVRLALAALALAGTR